MDYLETLNEVPTTELFRELDRRLKALRNNTCPYCENTFDLHNCKMTGKVATIYGEAFEIRTLAQKLSLGL